MKMKENELTVYFPSSAAPSLTILSLYSRAPQSLCHALWSMGQRKRNSPSFRFRGHALALLSLAVPSSTFPSTTVPSKAPYRCVTGASIMKVFSIVDSELCFFDK